MEASRRLHLEASYDAEAAEEMQGDAAGLEEEADEAEEGGMAEASRVLGLIPTGWYPTSVAVGAETGQIFVVNGKSNAGPNPLGCRDTTSTAPDAENACTGASGNSSLIAGAASAGNAEPLANWSNRKRRQWNW